MCGSGDAVHNKEQGSVSYADYFSAVLRQNDIDPGYDPSDLGWKCVCQRLYGGGGGRAFRVRPVSYTHLPNKI